MRGDDTCQLWVVSSFSLPLPMLGGHHGDGPWGPCGREPPPRVTVPSPAPARGRDDALSCARSFSLPREAKPPSKLPCFINSPMHLFFFYFSVSAIRPVRLMAAHGFLVAWNTVAQLPTGGVGQVLNQAHGPHRPLPHALRAPVTMTFTPPDRLCPSSSRDSCTCRPLTLNTLSCSSLGQHLPWPLRNM